MSDEYRKLTREELNELAGEELPERAAMSLISANLAAPVNAAVAANVLSDNSIAYANAEQTVDIDQSNSLSREGPSGPSHFSLSLCPEGDSPDDHREADRGSSAAAG